MVYQQCKVPSWLLFLVLLKEKWLKPLKMFCDNDPAEMSAISSIWGERIVRLFFWHLNRAIEKKLATERGRLGHVYNAEAAHSEFDFVETRLLPHTNDNNNEANGTLCVAARRKKIQVVIHRHYCCHSLIPLGDFRISCKIPCKGKLF